MTWGANTIHPQVDLEGGVTLKPDQELWTQSYDIDGVPIHVRANRFGGKATVMLNQATPLARDFLKRLIADANTGMVVAPFFIIDRLSGIGWSAPIARIAGLPDTRMAQESGVLSWVFLCPQIFPVVIPRGETELASSST